MQSTLRILLFTLATILTGCATGSSPPTPTAESTAICAPLVPAVASALTSVEHGGSLDVHEAAQLRLWESSCQATVWHLRLTDQLYGTHRRVVAAPPPDTRTFGERLLDVLVDNHRGGAIIHGTTCRTSRTSSRFGGGTVTNCSSY